MSNKLLLVIAGAAMMTACSTSTQRRDHAPVSVAPLTVHMEYALERNASSTAATLPEARLWFGFVSGAIFGEPTATLHEQTGNQREFTLDLNALAGIAERHAATLSPQAKSLGFDAVPAETRIGRVGTYNYDALTGNPIGSTGFVASPDRQTLLLVFVDRPCHLFGTIRVAGSQPTELNAVVHSAGFNWLKVVDEGTSKQRIVGAPALTAVTHLKITSQ